MSSQTVHVGCDVAPRTIQPLDVPDIRLHLLDQWRPGHTFARYWEQTGSDDDGHTPSPWSQERALSGSIYWVSADFFRVLAAMGSQIPDETRLDDLILPDPPNGLVVFEAQGNLLNQAGRPVALGAMTFTKTKLVNANEHDLVHLGLAEAVPGMYFSFYGRYVDPKTQRAFWWPFGRESWDFGESIPDNRFKGAPGAVGSLHLFAAFCALINQELRLADIGVHAPDRATGRRSQRAGMPATVRVVRLRKVIHESHDPHGERDVQWSHRWLVKGHMRLARVGPGRSQRRLVYVQPHVKGPEDRPLILKEVVNAVVR